jgi:hypothetical protein
MAKSDYSSTGNYEPRPITVGRTYLEYRFEKIDRDLRKKAPVKLGVKQTIIKAYKENGKNGAMLALRILNKKIGTEAFSWEQVLVWINEYERNNEGNDRDDR